MWSSFISFKMKRAVLSPRGSAYDLTTAAFMEEKYSVRVLLPHFNCQMLIAGRLQKQPPGGPGISVREVVGGYPSREAPELSGSEEEPTPERTGKTQVTHSKTRPRIFSLQVQKPPSLTDAASSLICSWGLINSARSPENCPRVDGLEGE